MKFDCVITSSNDNPNYSEFIPIFIKTWKKLYPNVDVKIIYIGDKIPDKYSQFKDNLILFKPLIDDKEPIVDKSEIPFNSGDTIKDGYYLYKKLNKNCKLLPRRNILTSFTAQYIRLLYPALLNYENAVMITDIDMIPLNKNYFNKHIENVDNNKFICTRGNIFHETPKQIPIMYNYATPKTWSEVFEIKTIDDVKNRLIEVFRENTCGNDKKSFERGSGKEWGLDQIDLYKYIHKWKYKTDRFNTSNDSFCGFDRLNRDINGVKNLNVSKIKNNKYTDFHMPVPFSKYSSVINSVVNNLS